MRMVQYVIQVQQLGLRVGAQKNRLNGTLQTVCKRILMSI